MQSLFDSIVPGVPGVRMASPPADRLAPISAAINELWATLPADTDLAVLGLANEAGANGAIVVRVTHGPQPWEVVGWLAKAWGGSVNYGAMVRKTWSWR
jgi:hypothetical protein